MPWIAGAALGLGTLLSGNSQARAVQRATTKSDALLAQGRTDALNNSGVQGYNIRGQQAADAQQGLLGIGGDPAASQAAFDNYLGSAGYRFNLKAGNDAITSSAAANGLLKGGATDKARIKFGQGLGSSYFDNYMQQLNGVAGRGQQAGQDIANIYTGNAVQRANNNTQGAGDAADIRGQSQRNALNIFGGAAGYGSP